MSSSQNNEIEKQEEDIFEELGTYDFQNELPFHKNKARQQLAISADSPFSNLGVDNAEVQVKRLREERAALLRDETAEIRRQLDLVKSRLTELKSPRVEKKSDSQISTSIKSTCDEKELQEARCSASCKEKPPETAKSTTATKIKKHLEAKFRPLTGKADCPNCTCDRRSSVCNECINLPSSSAVAATQRPKSGKKISNNNNNSPRTNQQPKWFTYEDDRPIRPAKDRTLATVEVVDDKVVPGRVYTISKSLNEKRTKLAQAIDDLESLMEQVKDKGEKLDQERKVVQLYKDQWKYGPSIGGPSASSRERLGLSQQNRNYESRLDPNLTRDSKSLSGYHHIESGMKLRQYGPPKTTIKTTKQVVHSRSKSLESLKPSKPKTKTSLHQRSMGNFHTGKSSSEVDLPSSGTKLGSSNELKRHNEDGGDDDEVEVEEDEDIKVMNTEEQVEESAVVGVQSLPGSPESLTNNDNNNPEDTLAQAEARNDENSGKVQRMSWIPVFGETEVKTIKRDPPKRKVQVVKSSNANNNNLKPAKQTTIETTKQPSPKVRRHIVIHSSLGKSKSRLSNESAPPPPTPQNGSASTIKGGNRVMTEATRKLRFASDLLEQEQRDCTTKNQLIVNKTKPTPAPRRQTLSPSNHNQQESNTSESIDSTAKEISRLEEMVNEQQRLLSRLMQSQDRCLQAASPTSIHCATYSHSPCHQTCSSPDHHPHSHHHRNGPNHKALIGTLRDRLNKTKTRLARTLEAEREKHQQLKLKVDSSLRKQSNLEAENELLKQSLSKCIDTCLRDISNTFESLSDTLNDSICKQPEEEEAIHISVNGGGGGGGGSTADLSQAAQLIADNRHLQQMKSHIEAIERQRKKIFEELSKEKQRSNQLELQLKESQSELNELMETKQRLETRLTTKTTTTGEQQTTTTTTNSFPLTNDDTHNKSPIASTSKQTFPLGDDSTTTDTTDLDDTLSVDVYRRYIQSVSPDIESIRRERKMILSEFDNIKKMLSDIDR